MYSNLLFRGTKKVQWPFGSTFQNSYRPTTKVIEPVRPIWACGKSIDHAEGLEKHYDPLCENQPYARGA